MVVEKEILKQVEAMEAWAIEFYEEIKDGANTSRMLELGKNINQQGRKLEWRGAGLKKLPPLKEVEELKQSIASARAGALRVLKEAEKADDLKKIQQKKGLTAKMQVLGNKLNRAVRNDAISVMNVLKQARAICEAEPWINDLNREGNEEVLLSLLRKKGYYEKFSDEEQIDILRKVARKKKRESRNNVVVSDDSVILNLPGVRINGLDLALLVKKIPTVTYHSLQIDLKGAQLRGVNFSGLSIRDSSFDEADMAGANFSGAKIFSSSFVKTKNWEKAIFTGAKITESNFSGSDLNSIDGSGISLEDINLTRSSLSHAVLNNASLKKTKFDDALWRINMFINTLSLSFLMIKQKTETATFAAGCFWGVEETFRQIKGVLQTSVGYTGGTMKNPSYKQVCTSETGHTEAVQVQFDPGIVSYRELLAVFWDCHDPTQLNHQGPDVGTEYRSTIFYHSLEQQKAAVASKQKLSHSGKYDLPIVTEILPATTFYKAEGYHQQYLKKRDLHSCPI